jgi:2'-phosphotransferase
MNQSNTNTTTTSKHSSSSSSNTTTNKSNQNHQHHHRTKNRNDDNHDTRISRTLTKILRHDAQRLGLNMSTDGFVRLDDIFRLPSFPRGVDEITVLRIVANDNKKRFSTKEEQSVLYIRANQGHSHSLVDANDLLEKIDHPSQVPICVHGTYRSAWEGGIREKGLCRMKRNQIHCATGEFNSETVISGMRSTSQILIYIDIAKCLALGIDIYRSENDVILLPGLGPLGFLPTGFFANVVDAKTGNSIPFVKSYVITGDVKGTEELRKKVESLEDSLQIAGATSSSSSSAVEVMAGSTTTVNTTGLVVGE